MRHPTLVLFAALVVTTGAGAESAPRVAWAEAAAADTAAVTPPVTTEDSTRAAPADTTPRVTPADTAGGESAPAVAPARVVDWLWVTRVSLESPETIARTVERARAMGVKGLLVQVIGRGDAWYRSDRLPRPEALARQPLDFDPLGQMLEQAHAAGLEVHAWVNCCLVWSADHPPADPRHVARAHPEWFGAVQGGRSLLSLGPKGWRRLGIEGAFLSPADVRVREWVAANVGELVRRYPVDGISLDYIRTPRVDAGYDGATRVAFAAEHGVDRARVRALPQAERAALDTAFAAFEDREVGAIVSAVRDTIQALRPHLPLSAAVRPDPDEAARWFGQPWADWLLDGRLDLAFPMCYSPATQTVLDQLVRIAHRVGRDRVIPGIAVYNAPPPSVASHLKGARALGFRELALYSYDALFEAPRYWERLAASLTPDPAP